MNTQPEALQMSDVIGFLNRLRQSEREGWRYADELERERKRLTEVNQMLVSVLENLVRKCNHDQVQANWEKVFSAEAVLALAKAKEQS